MDYGMSFQWVDGGLPFGGDVYLYDDHGAIVALLDRDSFTEDPDGFMASLERHCDSNVVGHGWHLALPVAVGEDRNPVPSRSAKARYLTAVAVLPLTGCAWIAAHALQVAAPTLGI